VVKGDDMLGQMISGIVVGVMMIVITTCVVYLIGFLTGGFSSSKNKSVTPRPSPPTTSAKKTPIESFEDRNDDLPF
jgi:hypothetical protein